MVRASDYYQPPVFYFVIPQGQHFHLELPAFLDADTGEPFDFTADPLGTWAGRMDVITRSGSTVVSFATSGEDGVISLGSDGVVSLDMADEYTANLSATKSIVGNAGAMLYGDVVLTDPADGEDWLHFKGKGHVTERVTA